MTCICIERAEGDDAITRIVRTDSSRTPAVIFSRPTIHNCVDTKTPIDRTCLLEVEGRQESESDNEAVQGRTSDTDCVCKNRRQMAVITVTQQAACQTEGADAADLARLVANQTKTIAGLEAAYGQ